MNDELRALLIKIGIMIMTGLAMKLHLDPSLNAVYPAVAADFADLILLGWSVYLNRGMKKVPVAAHATVNGVTVSNPGETKASSAIDVAGKLGTGLIAFLILFSPHDAQAQKATTASDPIMQIILRLKILTPEKVNAALEDALENNDPYSPDCWRFLLPLSKAVQSATPAPKIIDKNSGINLPLLYQKSRDTRRAVESLRGGLSDNVDLVRACGPMAMDSRMVLDRLILQIGGAALLR